MKQKRKLNKEVKEIINFRKEVGISAPILAKILGLYRTYWNDIEAGISSCPQEKIVEIRIFLKKVTTYSRKKEAIEDSKNIVYREKVCPIVPPPRKALILLHLRWDKRLSRFVPFVPPTKRKEKKCT